MKAHPSHKLHRPKVLFNHRSSASRRTTRNDSNGNTTKNSATDTAEATRRRPVDHPKGQNQERRQSISRSNTMAAIPALFTSAPPIRDSLTTQTSESQDETVKVCLPFLSGQEPGTRNDYGIPHLSRDRHIKFLQTQLGELPGAFKAMDPGRPWIFYWCLAALTLLGEDVVSYRERLIATVRPMQNEGGGFAGGFGQDSHLATTYAIVLSLALVGGDDAFEVVDRKSMWRWLGSLKQPNGGFQMAVGGEEDVRGAYCAAVIISLLNIPLDLPTDSAAYSAGHTDLLSGLGEWINRCQTYEGGVSAKPGTEAHGAYAFCALGCLSILDSPHRAVPRYLDVPRLISWISSRQNAPEGGFSGRTNKLVDGCYCHWVGGCWPLIQASLGGPQEGPKAEDVNNDAAVEEAGDHSLFSREGMIRYILCCCQDTSKRGGLRDKPSAYSDAYHTCYVLSGLSSVQHKWTLNAARTDPSLERTDKWSVGPFKEGGQQIFDEEDRVRTTHPVFVIPQQKAEDMLNYFAAKTGF